MKTILKLIARILIILAAAILVVGVTFAIVYASGAAQAASNFRGGGRFQPGGEHAGGFIPGQGAGGFRDGGNHLGRGEFGSGGTSVLFNLLSNLGTIAVIVVVVVLVERLLENVRRRKVIKTPMPTD